MRTTLRSSLTSPAPTRLGLGAAIKKALGFASAPRSGRLDSFTKKSTLRAHATSAPQLRNHPVAPPAVALRAYQDAVLPSYEAATRHQPRLPSYEQVVGKPPSYTEAAFPLPRPSLPDYDAVLAKRRSVEKHLGLGAPKEKVNEIMGCIYPDPRPSTMPALKTPEFHTRPSRRPPVSVKPGAQRADPLAIAAAIFAMRAPLTRDQ